MFSVDHNLVVLKLILGNSISGNDVAHVTDMADLSNRSAVNEAMGVEVRSSSLATFDEIS